MTVDAHPDATGGTNESSNNNDDAQNDTKDSKPTVERTDSNIRAGSGHASASYADAFFCPITDNIMENPVVAPDGVSYERVAIEQSNRFDKSKLYQNRALRDIMDQRMKLTGNSIRARSARLNHSMRQSIRKLVSKSTIPSLEYRPLEDALYCTITFDLMHVPVIDPDGNTFEKAAILNWIRANGESPITRKPLSREDLYPNNAIKALLDDEKAKPEEALHPSIRNFLKENPPAYGDEESSLGGQQDTVRVSNFPSNEEELEERRRDRGENTALCISVIFTLVLFVVLGMYAPVVLGFCILSLCVNACCSDGD